mmetsp:Transcript_20390/g.30516  ORF Transcript_20390/g.30516 Transcript_20390/m.30516 type:complete len:82 (-) Transcript_20390:1283-1528(-)
MCMYESLRVETSPFIAVAVLIFCLEAGLREGVYEFAAAAARVAEELRIFCTDDDRELFKNNCDDERRLYEDPGLLNDECGL